MPRLPRISAAVLLLSVTLTSAGRASTIISGGNIINQNWTPAGSPYVVQGDITVPNGSILTIEAGTTVQLATSDGQASGLDISKVEITVNGTLMVNGTSVQPVVFQSSGAPGPGRWYGIIVNTGSSVSLNHGVITGATQGLRVGSVTPLATVDGTRIEDSTFDVFVPSGTANIGGMLEAGKLSGNLNLGGLSLNRAASTCAGNLGLNALRADIATAASYEQLQVTGTVTIPSGAQFDVHSTGLTAPIGTVFTLIANDGADPIAGIFLNTSEGGLFYNGSDLFSVSYVGGTGNDLTLTLVEAPDLTLSKSGPATLPYSAGQVTYTLSVGATGIPATGVVVTDQLPSGLVYQSAVPSQGSCSGSGRDVMCNLGSIGAGGSATITITAAFNLSEIELRNVATATAASGDYNPLNSTDTVVTKLTSVPLSVSEEVLRTGQRVGSFPNPARASTRITFAAPSGASAVVEIYDSAGRLVRQLRQRVGSEGATLEWDGRDARGTPVKPGIFVYRAAIDGQAVGSDKVTIVR